MKTFIEPAKKYRKRNKVNISIFIDNLHIQGLLMKLPFATSSQEGYYEGSPKVGWATCLNFLNSYSVLGKNYLGVYELEPLQYNYNIKLHTWFSVSDGLIKFSISDSSKRFTHLLVKSKIIK